MAWSGTNTTVAGGIDTSVPRTARRRHVHPGPPRVPGTRGRGSREHQLVGHARCHSRTFDSQTRRQPLEHYASAVEVPPDDAATNPQARHLGQQNLAASCVVRAYAAPPLLDSRSGAGLGATFREKSVDEVLVETRAP